MDLFSSRVVGWSLGASMEASLLLEAFNRALGQRHVEAEQLLIHTDQGSQYRAAAYRELLEAHCTYAACPPRAATGKTPWRKACSPPSSRRLLQSSCTN
jgi:transposase InsO family protein